MQIILSRLWYIAQYSIIPSQDTQSLPKESQTHILLTMQFKCGIVFELPASRQFLFPLPSLCSNLIWRTKGKGYL